MHTLCGKSNLLIGKGIRRNSDRAQLCFRSSQPLAKANKFLFGNPDTEVYLKELKAKEEGFDWSKVARNLQKVLPFGRIFKS